MESRARDSFGRTSAVVMVAVAVMAYVTGVALLLADDARFRQWVGEDGPVEWLTFVVLLCASAWALRVGWLGVVGEDGLRFNRVWIVIGLACLFGALEEVSYGQRLLGIETPGFLKSPSSPGTPTLLYNRQNETNLHNLVVLGINVNRVVFGQLLALATALYLFVLPAIHKRRVGFRQWVDRSNLPVARSGPTAIFLLAVALAYWLRPLSGTGKFSEMQELIGVAVGFAVIADPYNCALAPAFGRRRGQTRLRLLASVIGLNVALGTVLRLAFLAVFRTTAGELAPQQVLQAVGLGLRFDLRLALLICLPLALLSWLPAVDPTRSARARKLWWSYFVLVQALVLLLYAIDFGYYDYLHTRLDAHIVDHTLSAGIALGMLWQTYPVLPIAAGLALLVVTYALVLGRLAFPRLVLPAPAFDRPRGIWRARRVAFGVALVALYGLGIYGKWSWYPLRWSDAFSGTSSFLGALALNPVLYAFDTVPDRGTTHDPERIRANYESIAALLEVDAPDPRRTAFLRHSAPSERLPFAPNLVVIHLEAFAGHKTSALGNRLEASPELDRIAADSLLFTNFFVPTTPTARSVFTMLTGIPDVNPVRSASRNPRLVSQRTLVNALEGYEKFYFLGGSATWANIRGLLAHNLPGLRIYEEGDYDAPRLNVWGVSDLDLFDRANEVLSQQSGPFFAFIQTAGNHGPYSIPDDRRGFELADLDEETVRENGFPSLAAYNSFRLLDYSLGRFFRSARDSDWFDRTIFVMYGDHGAPSARATTWEQIGLTHHHVPLVIHVPWRPELAGRVDHVASLVDLLPTCLGLMQIPYSNTTLGRDLLVRRPGASHFAFIDHGLLTDDYMLRVDPEGEEHLYAYRKAVAVEDLREELPHETARLSNLYSVLLDTSRHLLYNNAPL